jgi:transposase
MKPYSIEFRREVLADCDAGMSTMAVAIKRRVSESWVRRIKQRRRETGEIAARPPKKKTLPKWRAYADQLHGFLREQPDITLEELRGKLGIEISRQTLSIALRALKYTFKKKSSMPPSRIGRTWRGSGPPSSSARRGSTSNASSSSTKRGSKRT